MAVRHHAGWTNPTSIVCSIDFALSTGSISPSLSLFTTSFEMEEGKEKEEIVSEEEKEEEDVPPISRIISPLDVVKDWSVDMTVSPTPLPLEPTI